VGGKSITVSKLSEGTNSRPTPQELWLQPTLFARFVVVSFLYYIHPRISETTGPILTKFSGLQDLLGASLSIHSFRDRSRDVVMATGNQFCGQICEFCGPHMSLASRHAGVPKWVAGSQYRFQKFRRWRRLCAFRRVRQCYSSELRSGLYVCMFI